MVKIVGICGSPRKGGNCEQTLSEALSASQTKDGIEVELISLAGVDIKPCNGCYLCYTKGTRARPCPQFNDGMTEIYPRIVEADGFVFATPVYFGSVTGLMKAFMDRLFPFTNSYYSPDTTHGFRETLRLRPAGGIAVGGARNDGAEAVIYTFHRYFLYHDMIPVGTQAIGNTFGISAQGGGVVTGDKPNVLIRDKDGINTVRILGKKVAILAKALRSVRTKIEGETAL